MSRRLFLPLSADAVSSPVKGVLHAVDTLSTQKRDRRYKRVKLVGVRPSKWVTRCGAKVTGLTFAETSPGDLVAAPWPPPHRGEHTRCRECWIATGKKGPANWWRQIYMPRESERSA